MPRYEIEGHCPVCEQQTSFLAEREEELSPRWWDHWFRDSLLCRSCGSIPRERALMAVLTAIRPNWRELLIHESSPGARGASLRLQDQCPGYVATQYDTSIPFGSVDEKSNHRSEDLAAQTFPDGVFDVVVTQDVFEHLFDPAAAISEIRRTLKPNGICIMTVPIMRGEKPTIRRALMCDGVVRHLELPPLYHGNPISQEGSLVTIDWGNDIAAYLSACSGLVVTMHCIDDMTRGIRGIYNDVLVGRKTESLPVL